LTALAFWNNSLTMETPAPTNISTNSDAVRGEERRPRLPNDDAGQQLLPRPRRYLVHIHAEVTRLALGFRPGCTPPQIFIDRILNEKFVTKVD
jgi:hypothetical protein